MSLWAIPLPDKRMIRKTAGADALRLAAIVESSSDPIIGKDLSGQVFAWNSAAERVLGYTADEMIGQPLTTIFPPDRLQEEQRILDRIARGEQVERHETTRRCKDGRLIRVTATVSPIMDPSGQITGASTILHDLTERDLHVKRISELQAELAHVQRLTELGQVLTALVHEVNQPLTALGNYLSACRRLNAAGNSAGLDSALQKMAEQTTRTSDIIQRIRDYVRKRDVRMLPEDLSAVISEAVELTRSSVSDYAPSVAVELDPGCKYVEIDRIQVQQVLFNLMRNSIEAMQGQPTRDLLIATRATEPGMVEISVADTGPGLTEFVRKQLFQPFVTTKPAGMGVGLSVCQGIVQQHGGQIWSDQNTGGGATFRFTVRHASNEHQMRSREL
jgi:two-component system sensor kinase FixL